MAVKPKAKATAKPKAKEKPKASSSTELPPEGSAARKAMVLRGEIEE